MDTKDLERISSSDAIRGWKEKGYLIPTRLENGRNQAEWKGEGEEEPRDEGNEDE